VHDRISIFTHFHPILAARQADIQIRQIREGIVPKTSLLEVSHKLNRVTLRRTVMKSAATVLCLLVFATASFAVTPTIDLPRGLAVDAKGNLYVANVGGNNILVYSPGYVLQKSKTITIRASALRSALLST